jgi:hypothetical protein
MEPQREAHHLRVCLRRLLGRRWKGLPGLLYLPLRKVRGRDELKTIQLSKFALEKGRPENKDLLQTVCVGRGERRNSSCLKDFGTQEACPLKKVIPPCHCLCPRTRESEKK